jgi:hypothetical protein
MVGEVGVGCNNGGRDMRVCSLSWGGVGATGDGCEDEPSGIAGMANVESVARDATVVVPDALDAPRKSGRG